MGEPEAGDNLERDTTRFSDYCGPDRFKGKKWYGGHMGMTNDSNYNFFEGAKRFYETERYNADPSHSDHTYSFHYDMNTPIP